MEKYYVYWFILLLLRREQIFVFIGSINHLANFYKQELIYPKQNQLIKSDTLLKLIFYNYYR